MKVRTVPACEPDYPNAVSLKLNHGFRNSFGSLAIFAAICRTSSLLSSLAAERQPTLAEYPAIL
jgi:hypothetical protein